MEFFRSRKANSVAVFLASVLTVALFWALLPERFAKNESSDYFFYYQPVARSVLRGEGIALNGRFAYNNPPGYSILLAGVFWLSQNLNIGEETVNAGFILLCAGMSAACVFLLAEKIWGATGGWISAMFFATYPFYLWLAKQPGTELPFILFFYAALGVFWAGVESARSTKRIFFLAGVLAGAAMLVRAAAFGIGLLFAALLFALKKNENWKRRMVFASALLAGNLLAVAPWELAAYSAAGEWILLGKNGAPSVRDGLTFAVRLKDYRERPELPPDVIALQETFAQTIGAEESLAKIASAVWEQAKMQPAASLKLALIKALRCWYGTDSGQMETPILVIQIFYAAILALAVRLGWEKIKTAPLIGVLAALTLYFWFVAALALSILRYMVPVIGLFGLILAPAAENFLARSRRLPGRFKHPLRA